VIPAVAQLHTALAKSLLAHKTRLNGDEVRFLRKYVGWSGADFARHMGVEPGTVSRWETGKASLGATADRLLRLVVATAKQIDDYTVDALIDISDSEPPSQTRIKLSLTNGSTWSPVPACL
jgi:DNA-binding transcriptional regulator YiaG